MSVNQLDVNLLISNIRPANGDVQLTRTTACIPSSNTLKRAVTETSDSYNYIINMFAGTPSLTPVPTPRRSSIMATREQDVQQKQEYVEGNISRISYKKDTKAGMDLIDCGREVMCVRFSPDGALIAAGLSDGTIRLISPETGLVVYALSDTDTTHSKLPVTNIRFAANPNDGKVEHGHYLIATYASGLIKQWHYTSSSGTPAMWTINEKRQTLVGAFNPTGNIYATGGADPCINLYDLETKQLIRTLGASDSRDQMNGHRARVFAIQYHPRLPHCFISGGWDDTVQYWDDREDHAVRKFHGPHICGDGLDIDAHHNHILTSSWRKDDPLQIWDFNQASLIKTVPQDLLHKSLLYCGQWLGKEHIVSGGCDQNMLRVVDRGSLNTVGHLMDLPAGLFCLDNDRQSARPRIALGSGTKVWLLKLEKKMN